MLTSSILIIEDLYLQTFLHTLIVALTIVFAEMLFINLFEIVKIVRTFRIYALVYNKVFAIFFVFEIVRNCDVFGC